MRRAVAAPLADLLCLVRCLAQIDGLVRRHVNLLPCTNEKTSCCPRQPNHLAPRIANTSMPKTAAQ
jgi:hypothetical protein